MRSIAKYIIASAIAATVSAAFLYAQTTRREVRSISVDEQTALVQVGESVTILNAVASDHLTAKSVYVSSGCTSYTFALYSDSDFAQGKELLIVAGQQFNYYDGAPPVLRDSTGTGRVFAKFTNTGALACTFGLRIEGVGFR